MSIFIESLKCENNVNTEKFVKVAEYVDLFLYDFKESDSEKHKEFTGVDNKLIVKKLSELDKIKKILF